jgi:hypothetical protein
MGFRSGEYFGRKKSFGASRANELAHRFALVTAEIVHDDDVAFAKLGHEDLLDVGSKALAIDRPVKKPRRVDPVVAQSLSSLACWHG